MNIAQITAGNEGATVSPKTVDGFECTQVVAELSLRVAQLAFGKPIGERERFLERQRIPFDLDARQGVSYLGLFANAVNPVWAESYGFEEPGSALDCFDLALDLRQEAESGLEGHAGSIGRAM